MPPDALAVSAQTLSTPLVDDGPDPAPEDAAAPPRYRGPDPHLSPDELERLRALHGRFAGERIFVMGNGPSLNKMDLELLAGEHVFGLNRVSLLFPRVSWRPRFFTAFDLRVVPDNLDEFNELDIPYKFFATKHEGAILQRDSHYWYHDWPAADSFEDRFTGSPEITGFGGGGTVACTAIQIAAYLGFDPIILVGCDASYVVPDSVRQTGPDRFGDGVLLNLTSEVDDDVNHFDPSYFGKSKRWHSPNAMEMHRGFEKCYRQLERLGRTLVNATIGGALECVPRVTYDRLFPRQVVRRGERPPIVGIDLTSETAAMASGMRNSLMTSLQNTAMLGAAVRFVALCPDDARVGFYSALRDVPNFAVAIEGTDGYQNAVDDVDVLVHPFNHIETSLAVKASVKRIAYLNDLVPLTQPGFPETLRLRYATVAERADAVLCLSEITRSEIFSFFGISLDHCFVAPPSIVDEVTVVPFDEAFQRPTVEDIAAVRKRVGVKFTYLVYPAAFRPHKNHDRLFEALRYTYTNLQLVLTTGETHNPAAADEVRQRIERMRLGHRIVVAESLDNEAYRALLRGAEALVFPSLDEGFGIPVAEAQALRIPVIASRRGALADVALGSLEFDPEDHRDIADKIVELTSDDALKRSVVDAGWTNSRRFTKEWGARGLLDAIATVLDS